MDKRSTVQAMWRGWKGLCPNCQKGNLFCAFLKVTDHCAVCNQRYDHHRADDLPAYIVIIVTGHLLVPIMLWIEAEYSPPIWIQLSIWLPLILLVSLALLQPVKGVIVGLQWAAKMHDFGDPALEEVQVK